MSLTIRRASEDKPILQLDQVVKHFSLRGKFLRPSTGKYVRAVDGISLRVRPHETLSLVGESGCGKTTTAKMVLKLEKPTSGRILFRDQDISDLSGLSLRTYRSSVQAVFQDPWSSINPRMTAGDFVAEPLRINSDLDDVEVRALVSELLLIVGLEPSSAGNYPHEFSGGMRQRLAIARALGIQPALIVLDEPVSALDVSIRAQVMNLLRELQSKHGMAYLLIAHNLATVRYLSHHVAVMYLGEIVEQAAAEELFTNPLHPYTKALISASLPLRPGEEGDRIVLSGEVPSPTDPPPGCRFHTRCPFAFERCRQEIPELRELAPDHHAACHLY